MVTLLISVNPSLRRNTYTFSPMCLSSVRNFFYALTCFSWAAKMAHVDVYIFMCPQCSGNGSPEGVVETVVNNLHSQGVNYGMLWFDVEQCDGCWYGDLAVSFPLFFLVYCYSLTALTSKPLLDKLLLWEVRNVTNSH